MSSSATAKNLEAIIKAVRQHDASCTEKAKAVAMCAFEVDRLDFDSIPVDGRDIPIIVGESIGSGRFRVICDGYHGPKREEEVQDTVEAPAPSERELVPARAPEEGLPEHEEGGLWTPGDKFEPASWQLDFFQGGRRHLDLIGGRSGGRRWAQETFRRLVGEHFPDVEIREPLPGVVTYRFPDDD